MSKKSTAKPELLNADWPGEAWPDLVGTPAPTRAFIKSCAYALEKGNGIAAGHLLRNRLRFITDTMSWIYYETLVPVTNHGSWRQDFDGMITEKSVELVALMYLREASIVQNEINEIEAKKSSNDKADLDRLKIYRKKLTKTADFLRTVRGVNSTKNFARAYLAVKSVELNANRYLMVFINTTIDFAHGGQARPGCPEDLNTLTCNTGYHGCEIQDDLLNEKSLEIHNNNPALDDYFWRWLGFALIGVCTVHEILILFGPRGRNGKSLLLGAIISLLGDYASFFQPELLIESRFPRDANAPTPAFIEFMGRRLMACSELSENQKLATGRVKQICSDDLMVARQRVPLYDLETLDRRFVGVISLQDKKPPGFWHHYCGKDHTTGAFYFGHGSKCYFIYSLRI